MRARAIVKKLRNPKYFTDSLFKNLSMTPGEEDLLGMLKQYLDLRNRIVMQHMDKVAIIARMYAHRCFTAQVSDLIQAGAIGLIESVDRFKEGGAKLMTYADWRIKRRMLEVLYEQSIIFTHKGNMQQVVFEYGEAERFLEFKLGRSPSEMEIHEHLAERTGHSLEMIRDIIFTQRQAASFDKHDSEDVEPNAILNSMPAPEESQPENVAVLNQLKRRVHRAILDLPLQQRTVMQLLLSGLRQCDIAQEMGHSNGSSVCQLKSRAEKRLKPLLKRRGITDSL